MNFKLPDFGLKKNTSQIDTTPSASVSAAVTAPTPVDQMINPNALMNGRYTGPIASKPPQLKE